MNGQRADENANSGESTVNAADEAFDAPPVAAPSEASGAALFVDVSGFEGPLDLLLTLARTQKVDLRKISILALADQYLEFINGARKLELDLAADYLVMAAWLAYLKSKLLLPEENPVEGEPSGEELAARLAFRLQKLEAMRDAAARLMARDRLGRDVFSRGMPEGIRLIRTPQWGDNLFDLLKAYAEQRVKKFGGRLSVARAPVYAIEEARKRLESMLGAIPDWSRLDALLPEGYGLGKMKRTAVASTLSASLEMARDGKVELRQMTPFGAIYLRSKTPDGDGETAHG